MSRNSDLPLSWIKTVKIGSSSFHFVVVSLNRLSLQAFQKDVIRVL